MNLLVLNCVVFQKLMGQDGSRDNRWVMTHGSYGSWVTSSMGHVGHGSLCMTHLQLCSVFATNISTLNMAEAAINSTSEPQVPGG